MKPFSILFTMYNGTLIEKEFLDNIAFVDWKTEHKYNIVKWKYL